jgi:hypothetical protein
MKMDASPSAQHDEELSMQVMLSADPGDKKALVAALPA